ncbi:DUF7503 family protein [Haladaptatus sp. DFWS20]
MFGNNTLHDKLVHHPRLTTALFVVTLLLMQAGNAAAGICSTCGGP